MKKLLGDVDICGLPFSVYLADEQGEPGLGKAYGLCFPDDQRIIIAEDTTPEIRRLYLLHEIMHGVWTHCGVDEIIHLVRDKETRQELIIRTVTPHMIRAMADAEKLL